MIEVLDADGNGLSPSARETESVRWHQRLARGIQRNINAVIVMAGVLLVVALYFAPQIFISIHSGEVGVLYLRFFGGTQSDKVLGEGMKVIMPWDKLFIYNVRIQERKHTMDLLTNEGLDVKLELSIRYHPEIELVGLLHQQVGPDYAEKVVLPEVESALRTTMAGLPLRDVYAGQRGLMQTIINDSLEHVSEKFVRIDEIIVRQVVLPAKISASIEEKIAQKEQAEAYEYRIDMANKESARLKIEAEGIKAYQDILNTSLTANILRWQGIEATRELAKSPNTKTIIIGDKSGLPLIMGDK